MAFVPAVNTLKVTFEYTLAGRVVVNIYYFQKNTPILTVDLTNVINAVKSWYDLYLKPGLSQDIALFAITATDMTTATGQTLTTTYNPPVAGTAAVATLPGNVAVVITRLTGFAGRSYRGRLYIAGIPETYVTLNTIDAVYLASLVVAHANLDTYVNPLNFTEVVVSKFSAGAPRATALLTPITGYGADGRVDTQRRRLT